LLFLFHTTFASNDVKKTTYANSFGASVVESGKKTVLVISTVGLRVGGKRKELTETLRLVCLTFFSANTPLLVLAKFLASYLLTAASSFVRKASYVNNIGLAVACGSLVRHCCHFCMLKRWQVVKSESKTLMDFPCVDTRAVTDTRVRPTAYKCIRALYCCVRSVLLFPATS
jgi:hypothetical protein